MNMNYNDMNTPSRYIGDENEIFSFYIPRISKNYTEEDIKFVFNINCIGEVKRVDFAEITSENHRNNSYNSAFVHMNNVLNTPIGNMIINETHDMNTSYKLYTHPTRPEYWVLLKNHKPIKDTDLNIHQLAENTRLLEEKVTSQDNILTEQQNIIKTQQEQIERLQESLDQLMGQENDNYDEDYDEDYDENYDENYNDNPMTIDELETADNAVDNERPLLAAWHKYREGGVVHSKEFRAIFEQSRQEDLLNNIDPLNKYGYDFYENNDGSMSMECKIQKSINSYNDDNRQLNNRNFESSLDMETRKLFSTHLCNN